MHVMPRLHAMMGPTTAGVLTLAQSHHVCVCLWGVGGFVQAKAGGAEFTWALFRLSLNKSVGKFAHFLPEALSWTRDLVTSDLHKSPLALPLVLWTTTRH